MIRTIRDQLNNEKSVKVLFEKVPREQALLTYRVKLCGSRRGL